MQTAEMASLPVGDIEEPLDPARQRKADGRENQKTSGNKTGDEILRQQGHAHPLLPVATALPRHLGISSEIRLDMCISTTLIFYLRSMLLFDESAMLISR